MLKLKSLNQVCNKDQGDVHHVRGAADAAQDDERPVHWADEEADPHDLARHQDQGDGHNDQGAAGSDNAQDDSRLAHETDEDTDLHKLDCQQVK